MSVYALTVATPGKMKLSPDETVPAPGEFPRDCPGCRRRSASGAICCSFVDFPGRPK